MIKAQTEAIVYVAGRSGGHIIPCITLAREYVQANERARTVFIATESLLDKKIIQQNSFLDRTLFLSYERRAGLWGVISFVFQSFVALCKSMQLLLKERPVKVVSSGGYVGLPVCLAAFLLRIPVDLYELNAVPGKATLVLAKIATRIYICFAQAQKYIPRGILISYPVRFSRSAISTQEYALCVLELAHDKTTLVILGGSQGSHSLNSSCIDFLSSYPDYAAGVQIVHQCGSKDVDFLRTAYARLGISARVFDYYPALEILYSAANIVIARAGAGTLFELLFFNKRAIIIPLEGVAGDHQVENSSAMELCYPDKITVLRQKSLSPESLMQLLRK